MDGNTTPVMPPDTVKDGLIWQWLRCCVAHSRAVYEKREHPCPKTNKRADVTKAELDLATDRLGFDPVDSLAGSTYHFTLEEGDSYCLTVTDWAVAVAPTECAHCVLREQMG